MAFTLVAGMILGIVVGALPSSPQTAGNHTTAGTYHGIYREGSTYHHAWTEHDGHYTGNSLYVWIINDSTNQIVCADGIPTGGHSHCTAYFSSTGWSAHVSMSETPVPYCAPGMGDLFADYHGVCYHAHI